MVPGPSAHGLRDGIDGSHGVTLRLLEVGVVVHLRENPPSRLSLGSEGQPAELSSLITNPVTRVLDPVDQLLETRVLAELTPIPYGAAQ